MVSFLMLFVFVSTTYQLYMWSMAPQAADAAEEDPRCAITVAPNQQIKINQIE